jgi:hypothetical protein
MRYATPEVIALGLASEAIQNTQKGKKRIDAESLPSVNAYEADE